MRIEVERYKRMLQDKQGELLAAMRQREAIAVGRSPDVIDELQAAVERERAVLELDRASRVLRDVNTALARIREGTFGVCLRCDQTISTARLNAVPWTSFCITCQQELDEEGASAHEFSPEYFPHAV
ncbi:MAG TPA: TraR/DksA C4-type zinc finger protein [Bryobacteraceae bacterium]|jgi:DnaK suppressor protein|nr:TraR/DksA C4-type zinc finger protein [Bryobacteraceae bacterium]